METRTLTISQQPKDKKLIDNLGNLKNALENLQNVFEDIYYDLVASELEKVGRSEVCIPSETQGWYNNLFYALGEINISLYETDIIEVMENLKDQAKDDAYTLIEEHDILVSDINDSLEIS